MKRMFIFRSLVMAMLLLAVLCMTGCHKETEEDKIRNMISSLQKAVKNKDTGDVLGQLSKAYRDPQGNDYNGIKGLLLFYFMKHRSVNVYVPSLDISVDNNAARASFQAVLTGAGTDQGLLPEAFGVYEFNLVLQKESGAWKITSAKWERMGDGPVMGGVS